MSKSTCKTVFGILLPTLVLIVMFLELFFRFVIPAAQKPIAYYDEQYNILRSDSKNRTDGIYTIGKFAQIRTHWHINNYGWNSPYDYYTNSKDKKLICIIGDSFIRALHVDTDKSVTSLLNENLSDKYKVYGFGYDGAPLSQYLHMSRYVDKVFDPDILIFLIIHNDFDQSIRKFAYKPYFLQYSVDNDRVDEIQPTKQNFYQFLTYSTTFRYLYANMKLSSLYFGLTNDLNNFNENVDASNLYKLKEQLRLITDYSIATIRNENKHRRIILVMNAPRQDIYQDTIKNSNLLWINRMVAEIAGNYKVEFIDLSVPFDEDYRLHRKKFNSDYDNHWNEYGHYVASKVITDYLKTYPR